MRVVLFVDCSIEDVKCFFSVSEVRSWTLTVLQPRRLMNSSMLLVSGRSYLFFRRFDNEASLGKEERRTLAEGADWSFLVSALEAIVPTVSVGVTEDDDFGGIARCDVSVIFSWQISGAFLLDAWMPQFTFSE